MGRVGYRVGEERNWIDMGEKETSKTEKREGT